MNVSEEIAIATVFLDSQSYVQTYKLIGSALYLPNPKDVDFAVLVKPGIPFLVAGYDVIPVWYVLQNEGFRPCSNEYGNVDNERQTEWAAFRKDNLNFMVTNDETFYRNYLKAMDVCRFLKLEHKWQRVGVCQIIRDNVMPDEFVLKAKYPEEMTFKEIAKAFS